MLFSRRSVLAAAIAAPITSAVRSQISLASSSVDYYKALYDKYSVISPEDAIIADNRFWIGFKYPVFDQYLFIKQKNSEFETRIDDDTFAELAGDILHPVRMANMGDIDKLNEEAAKLSMEFDIHVTSFGSSDFLIEENQKDFRIPKTMVFQRKTAGVHMREVKNPNLTP